MVKKIPVVEVLKKLQDPATDPQEIAKYFITDENRSTGPFDPALAYNPTTVELGKTLEARARSNAALPVANGIERARRHADFELKLLMGYSGPILVSEGDSWFQFPLILRDVIDNVSDIYAVSSLDAAGDTLEQMIQQNEYMDEIHDEKAAILLFSGGGNDALGGGDLKSHLRVYDPDLPPAQHVRASFNALVDKAVGQFDQIYRRVAREAPGVHIISHGYDYAIPNSGKWLGQPMEEHGIVDKNFQREIVKELINRFAAAMMKLARKHPHVAYLDNRGTVKANEWYDELHPNDAGFRKIGAAFNAKVKQLAPTARGLTATRAPRSRRLMSTVAPQHKGLSLHIGLNEIDPAHYGSKNELSGCHNDAKAMAAIAKARGYEVMGTLLDKDAKAKALHDKVKEAAKSLSAGDIFLLTYAGHGGQIPDFSGDETGGNTDGGGQQDGMDETWCLFDRELLDDEQYEFWGWFKDGVRILVVSDSCHSGSVIRATENGTVTIDPSAPNALPYRTRLLPRAARTHVATHQRGFYRKISEETAARLHEPQRARRHLPGAVDRLDCTVRLLSGCQDHQTSADGDMNGLFTQQMLLVLERGFKGDYAAFHREIRRIMPDNQTPNHWVIGRKDAAYDSQSPFEI